MIRNSPSIRRARRLLALLVLALAPAATSCKSLGDLNVFSLKDDVQLGQQSYQEFLSTAQTVSSGPQAAMVQEVTGRLTQVAEERQPETAGAFEWEATLVESEEVNAWCLPGGKMVVYTGILPVTQDPGGLAVVMGHEISHATLRHGTKKLTRSMGLEVLQMLAQPYVGEKVDPQLLGTVVNVVAELPYSREDELEADREGLMTMAAAGYDPREAVEFWRRMAANSQGAPPELLSTHPSDARRIEQMEALLPEALEVYQRATGAGGALRQ